MKPHVAAGLKRLEQLGWAKVEETHPMLIKLGTWSDTRQKTLGGWYFAIGLNEFNFEAGLVATDKANGRVRRIACECVDLDAALSLAETILTVRR